MFKKLSKSTLAILAAGILLPLILALAFVFTPKREKITAEAYSGTIFAGSDIQAAFSKASDGMGGEATVKLNQNVSTSSTLVVGGYNNVNLDLNGYVLTYTGSSGSVIIVYEGAVFKLIDSRPNVSNTVGGKSISGGVITGGKGTLDSNMIRGGGIYGFDGSTVHINGGTIYNNSAGYGGGIYMSSSTFFQLNDGKILENTATYQGGGLWISDENDEATINDGFIRGNYAGGVGDAAGGGVYIAGPGTDFYMNGGFIEENTVEAGTSSSSSYGGGIYCYNTTLELRNCEIYNNKVIDKGSDYSGGGGVCIAGSSAFLSIYEGGLITNNTCEWNNESYGGGVIVKDGATLEMVSGNIFGNYAYSGGGIYIYDSISNVIVRNGYITNNNADELGGGIAGHIDKLSLIDAPKIYDNTSNWYEGEKGGNASDIEFGYNSYNYKINISGALTDDAKIGVRIYPYTATGVLTTGGKINSTNLKYFFSDDGRCLSLSGNEAQISSTAHTYTVSWSWSEYTSATATFTCSNCGHTETVTANGAAITNAVTTQPTCTTNGVRTYTAKVAFNGTTYSGYNTQTIPATGHSYGAAVWTWATDGKSASAKITCTKNSSHVLSGNATVTSTVKTAATCTTNGTTTYTAKVTLNGTEYTSTKDVEDIAATGHKYGSPVWTWTNDGKSATAKITCSNNTSHVLSETGTVANGKITSVVKVAATCTTKGTTTYTAKATLNGTEYTDKKDVEDIAVLGHTIDGITVSGPATRNYTAFETIITDELSVYTHCETCKQNVDKLNFGADGYSVVYKSGNYLNAGDTTVKIKYASYAEAEISGLNVSAKETDVIWEYYDGSNWLQLPAGKSYVYDPDKGIATELRARIVNAADSGEKTFRADNALVISKKGGVTQSEIKDVGTYTLALDADNLRFGNYDLRGNSATVEITAKEIDLNAVNAFYWRLKDLSSHLRTGYIDKGDYNYYTEGGDGRTYVVRSIVRDRGREIEIQLNGTETDRYTISYENNKATGKGQYTSIANLVMTDSNYKFVCNGIVDGDRHILFEITDGGKVAKVTKEWYIAKIDNGLKSQHDPDYGEEWSITGWTYGEYETRYAPRLEHGDTGEYKSVIDFTVSDNGLVTFDLYYKAAGSEEVEIATGFSRADFNKYINGSMPAGEYRLVVHATEFHASEGHIHWYDGTPHDTTSGELGSALYFAPFNRQFDFEVSAGTMTANVSELSESYMYTYNGEMQVYGDYVLTVGDQPEREGEWANGKYDAYYSGAEMQFNLKRWNTGNYLTMSEMALRENKSSKPVNADEYTLYYRVVAKNYVNLGGTEADYFKVIINKAEVEKPENKEETYNGSAYTYDVAAGAGYYVSGTATYTNAKEDGYDITLKLDDSDNYKWEGADGDSVTVKLIIYKAEVGVPASQTVDYNGAPQNYTVDGDAPYTVTSGAYTDANEAGYAVTLTLKDPDNYKWADESAAAQVKLIIKPVKQESPDTEGHVHVWSHAVGHNDDVHYVECLSCGERKDEAEHEYNWVLDTAPTTEATGLKHEECSVCGYRRSEGTAIPKPDASHAHTMKHITKVSATCTEAGVKEYWHCTGCKKYFADEAGYLELTDIEITIPAKGHSWSESYGSNGDYHYIECTDCGERKDVAEHEYNWVLDTAPTNETTGLKHEECSICGHKRNVGSEIPKPDASHTHTMEHVAEVPATCTEAGFKAYWHCTGCEKNFADEAGYLELTDTELAIPAKGHHWSTDWESDTASHWHKCTDCSERKDEAEHNYIWVLDRVPTTESTGLKHEECSVCGHKRNVGTEISKPEAGHNHTMEHVAEVPATCTEAGVKEYWHCTGCNKYFADEAGYLEITDTELTIPAKGHRWSESYTGGSDGHWFICLDCEERKDIRAHDYIWVLDRAPTTESTGLKHEECSICGHKRNVGTEISKLDENETHTHNLVRVRATTATCTNNGNREYWHCSTCNKSYFDREGYLEVEKEYVTRPATGHIWSEEWESDSTSHWHVCLTCVEKQMTEHSYVWKTDIEPTKESDGSKHEECTVCGHKRSVGTLIDRLPVPSGEKDNSVPWWVWLLISLCVVAVGAGVTSLILIRRNAKKNSLAATVAVPAENSNSDVIMQRLNEHEEKIDELMNRDDGGFGDIVNPDEFGGDGLDGDNNN